MIKKSLSIGCLLLFLAAGSAFGQVKIGFMNTQEVLSQLPQRSDVEQKLNAFIRDKRTEFQQRTTAFQDSVAAFQQNQGSMSQQQIQQEQKELAQMESELRQHQQNLQAQIQQRRARLLKPLYDEMDQAIATVAEEQDLDFVLNEATNMGENVIFYSSSENLNITSQVLERIKGSSSKN